MAPPAKIGRYEIREEKGQGAMGAVYLARDPAMDRVVALKTIHSVALTGPQGKEYRERFYGEARAAGRLAHPGIVPVFDVGEQDGLPYLVMEYIEGQTLADAAKSGRRLSLDRVCEIGQQIAEALGYAHKNGVVHRDIKPANVLLTSKDKYGIERPKITDFGVAKVAASQLTTTGQLLGTPAFMPPEQFTGAVIDGRSDLFSFGVILYWLATGEQPFPGETITAVSYKVVHTEPVPPAKLNPAIPAALEQIILKCLAKDPAARYQTGEELARQLAALRAGPSVPVLFDSGSVKRPPILAAAGTDVTLDSDPSLGTLLPTHHAAAAAQPSRPAQAKTGHKTWSLAAMAAIAALLLVAAYLYHSKTQPHSTQAAVQAPPAQTPPEAPAKDDSGSSPASIPAGAVDPETTPAKKTPRPAKDSAVPDAAESSAADTPIAPEPAPGAATPAPEAAHVDFDPAALKPNENAKLRIEAEHFPPNLGFTLEMDGKVYFERGIRTQTVFDNLYAPPGIHEFRVVAGLGASRKTSNIVSTEFRPKKRKTLRIELRSKAAKTDSSVPQGIDAESQLVLTLK
jgi:eukaryotic-like serine/threonine-protein kinase